VTTDELSDSYTTYSELAWLDVNNLPENVIPSVKFVIENIAAGKQFSEYGWN